MIEMQSSEAKARFASLLNKVERGETILIKRRGKVVARLSPERNKRQEEIEAAIEGIKELRKHTGKITIEEIISSIHEGHKY